MEIKDGKTNWDTKMYKQIAPYGKKESFEWGGNWKNFKDNPHFQVTKGKSTYDLETLYHRNDNEYKKIKL